MTIKKQWLLVLILIAVLAVVVNTLVLSSLTNRYFKDYVKDSYEKHFNEIVDYLTGTLKEDNYSLSQIDVELETHLIDPITRIKVYDENGNLIADVSADVRSYIGKGMMNGMMNGMMGNMMGRMQNSQLEEIDHADIRNGNTLIGQVNITKYSAAEDSFATWMFRAALIRNSVISIGIVLIIAVIVGILVSKRMSRDLVNTAEMAQNIDIGNNTLFHPSKVKEIRIIQQSLESLKSRLLLKQKSRKTLIDELIHQTRTPLTILRTHLEGIEDGVIEMVPDEIRVCESQIDNITAIITNMSSLIDAEKTDEAIHIEEFELSQLVKQIVNGLRLQFERKMINLNLNDCERIVIKTDKYKLSQAIYNILTNAYKFTESGGTVTVYYRILEKNIVLTIEDNGPGISQEDQLRIFDAYYKKDISAGSAGDGLGLYVARENMINIKGALAVESKKHQGSRFILTIPGKI